MTTTRIEAVAGETRRREPWEQWQVDANSAEAYERHLVPLFMAPGARYLIELAALGPDERVLDVGCGTGIVARTAAARVGAGGTIVGLDMNEGMLAVARRLSAEVRPTIEWRQGDAARLPFSDAAFDVVFCQQALQFFPDRLAALREMHRVLAPDGRLALSVMRSTEHNPGYAALADAFERRVGPEAGAMERSPFPALSAGALRQLIAGAGFREVRLLIGIGPARYPSVAEFVRQEAASSPLAGPIGALPGDVRDALIHDVEEALREYADDDGIVFPTATYLVVGRR
jgi:ubiquinone/menaquinone biosynthesis C-methylase UbiE